LQRRGFAAEIERGASFIELVLGRRIEFGIAEDGDGESTLVVREWRAALRQLNWSEMRQLDWRIEGF
jgi:hypothetical protein